jgi:AcrR family transcriptional regulator
LAQKKSRSAEMSRRMDLLWGGGVRTPRGPKPALTLDRIVQRAVEIADKKGLQAVTMQSVAKRLGVTTMALYRYVASKSELIDGMVETSLGKPPTIDSSGDWRARLATWARGNLDIYQRHPWVLHAIIASPPCGPNQLAWLEAALDALFETRLSPAEMLASISLVDDHVRGSAHLRLALATTSDYVEWYGRALHRASADERYPRIAALAAAGAFADAGDTTWDQFDFGLERVLDGVEAFIETRYGRSGTDKSAARKARAR